MPPPAREAPPAPPAGRFAALAGVLRRMLAAYREYAAEEERKNAALVRADFSGVEAFGRRERELADRLVALERERRAAAAALVTPAPDGPAGNAPAATVPLRELLARHPEDPAAAEVDTLRKELLAECDRVGELNRRNLSLLEKSMEIVDFTLKTVRELTSRENETYNRRGYDRGAAAPPAGLTLLDVKI